MSKHQKKQQLKYTVPRNSVVEKSPLKSPYQNQSQYISPKFSKPINLGQKVRPVKSEKSLKKDKLRALGEEYGRVSAQFQDIINNDRKDGKILQKIKNFIDFYVRTLVDENPDSYIKQVETLSRENFFLSKEIERLQTEHSEEMPTAKRNSHAHKLPPLNLLKPAAMDFHQEFLSQADEFSNSWRDALKAGR